VDARLSVGRGEDNALVLPDAERLLSKSHCVIERRSAQYVVIDRSANGTFLNDATHRLPREVATPLNAGDHLRLGRFDLTVVSVIPPESGAVSTGSPRRTGDEVSELGLLGPVSNHSRSESPPRTPAPTAVADDPLASGASGSLISGAGYSNDPQMHEGWWRSEPWPDAAEPDHTPAEADIFVRPKLHTEPIPDDWDAVAELGVALPKPGRQAPEAPEISAVQLEPPRPAPTPDLAEDIAAVWTPNMTHDPVRPVVGDGAVPAMIESNRNDRQVLEQRLVTAFLAGCGLPDTALAGRQAEQLLASAGRILRIAIDGLLQLLAARTLTKQEFRIEYTMISRGANNPLKFINSLDEALRALLLNEIPGCVPADDAVREAMTDIKAHQIAVISGMQAALASVTSRFDPVGLESAPGQQPVTALVPSLRKAQAWDRFKARYAELSHAMENGVQGVFGAEFARAYEARTNRVLGDEQTSPAKKHSPFGWRDPATAEGASNVD
jgi:type VI secretion system protein ImpI/type VI secretion system protein